MKSTILVLFSIFAIAANAQVRFTILNVKDKGADYVYAGPSNIFKVTKPDDVSITNITPSQGNISMNSDGSFSLYVKDVSDKPIEIKYTQTKNGVQSEVTYPKKYMIKKMPDVFQLKVGEYTKGGTVSLDKMRENHQVSLSDAGFNIGMKNYAIQFELFYQPYKQDPRVLDYNSKNEKDVMAYNGLLSNLREGDRIFFEKVKITTEDGASREIPAMNFRLVK